MCGGMVQVPSRMVVVWVCGWTKFVSFDLIGGLAVWRATGLLWLYFVPVEAYADAGTQMHGCMVHRARARWATGWLQSLRVG